MMTFLGLALYFIIAGFAAWLDLTDRTHDPKIFFGIGVMSVVPLLFIYAVRLA